MKSFKWIKEKAHNGSVYPKSREGHSITYISDKELIVLFGGLSGTRLNELLVYDMKQNQWIDQPTSGRVPSARCYHTTFYDESTQCMYLYGGQGEKGRSMGDFYFINVNSWTWKKLFIQEIPPSRHQHVFAETQPGELDRIIFGGVCLPENQLLNDLWIFDYSKIDNRSNLTDVSGAQCLEIQTYGQQPTPRRGSCSFSVDKKLFIFGGQCQEKDIQTNTLYCLSFDTWEWAIVDCIGQPPPSRSFLTAGVFTNRRIIFFGGLDNETSRATNEVNILTLNDFYWSSPFQAGMKAGPRYHHSSCLIENDNHERQLVILGGLDFTFCSMELCILYETDADQVEEWEQLQEPSELDLIAQEKAGLMIFENKQYINELNDLISQERQKSIKCNEEKEQFDQENKKQQEQQKKNEEQQKQQLKEQQDQNVILKRNMEDIFLLIKQEQILSKELITKNKLLEITIQKVQDYQMPLDQFFTQLSNNKFDEKDQKEIKLKNMVDEVKDEVYKSRDLHKESLYRLKKNYERINQSLQTAEQDLEKNRRNISQIDKQYEQIICETEVEEQ